MCFGRPVKARALLIPFNFRRLTRFLPIGTNLTNLLRAVHSSHKAFRLVRRLQAKSQER